MLSSCSLARMTVAFFAITNSVWKQFYLCVPVLSSRCTSFYVSFKDTVNFSLPSGAYAFKVFNNYGANANTQVNFFWRFLLTPFASFSFAYSF
jgi:hypothetical protein